MADCEKDRELSDAVFQTEAKNTNPPELQEKCGCCNAVRVKTPQIHYPTCTFSDLAIARTERERVRREMCLMRLGIERACSGPEFSLDELCERVYEDLNRRLNLGHPDLEAALRYTSDSIYAFRLYQLQILQRTTKLCFWTLCLLSGLIIIALCLTLAVYLAPLFSTWFPLRSSPKLELFLGLVMACLPYYLHVQYRLHNWMHGRPSLKAYVRAAISPAKMSSKRRER